MSTIGTLHRLLELGRGGMARVWLAVSTGAGGFRKLVVVKQLRPEYTHDARVRTMFVEEARLAAKLNHPNTVQTLEVAEQDDELFIVMEYLDGQPLDVIQRHSALTMSTMLSILVDTCAGLHHAHELRDLDGTPLGVVHRDVSPQNIFVTYTGQVKVVDFGIAKTFAGSGVSQAGEIKGKINYMAPEQALGAAVDRRADIFSIGVLLYGALSGRRLWEGTPEATVIERLRSGDIPKLVPRPSGLSAPSAELIAICNKCIAANARERFSTAHELQVALEGFAKRQGGLCSRGELAAFLSSAFEEQRVRRQSVIEEKVRSLTEGTLLTNSVRRRPSIPPPEVKSKIQLKSTRPAVMSASSDQLLKAVLVEPARGSNFEQSDRVSRVPTERPLAESAPQPSKGSWRMPEPYKLVSRLTQSALIFEAKDTSTKRGVTVQLLKGALSDEHLSQRYGRVARLRHPNTVRVLDVGSVKAPVPVTYIVRENVVGTSLASLLPLGALDQVDALRVAVGILESLAEAHDHEIVHGRLTPSHVLLEDPEEGELQRVKVLGYWPPTLPVKRQEDEAFYEPAGGESLTEKHVPTVASDIYAVGQIVHLCLTGRTYDGTAPVTWVDSRLAAVLNRALSKEPRQRFQTAGAMLDALRRVDWTCPRRGEVMARDRYLCGAMPTVREQRLPVQRNELVSRGPTSVWVLDGDPTIGRSNLFEALSELRHIEVRLLGEADRELAYDELMNGRVKVPSIIVFGSLHVVLGERLLQLVRTSAETSKLVFSPTEDFELLHRSVQDVGLDAQLFETADKADISKTLNRLIQRTRVISESYDVVRLQLQLSRDELTQRSRELTAFGGTG